MGDMGHTTYKNPEGTTTEWDDIQVSFQPKMQRGMHACMLCLW